MDHISNLPDEVLCHILSFVPTKEAALTSILAKRWRNLLAFVPSLTFDDSVFLHPEKGKRDREDIRQSFMGFVDRVLALQGNSSPLKKFSLECLTGADTDRLDAWIISALARGVSDLDLQIIVDLDLATYGLCYQLSPKCFECSTLVKLSMGSGIDVTFVAACIFLPMLKTLVLDWVKVYPNEFETLLHALPSLEELVLVRVMWNDSEDVRVLSASVKTLRIKSTFGSNPLSIDTPSLLHFEYSDSVAPDLVNMGNLVDAQISLSEDQLKRLREPYNDQDALRYRSLWKIFHGLRNVHHLSLLPDTHEVFSMCSESMPVFNNLKSLAIRSDKDRGWEAMPAILSNCPHLETLVIQGLVHHVTDECGDACVCISREDKGLSLTLCPVKVVKIHGFQGTMEEMAMLKHFLDYLPCLKEMQVFAEENNDHLVFFFKVV